MIDNVFPQSPLDLPLPDSISHRAYGIDQIDPYSETFRINSALKDNNNLNIEHTFKRIQMILVTKWAEKACAEY